MPLNPADYTSAQRDIADPAAADSLRDIGQKLARLAGDVIAALPTSAFRAYSTDSPFFAANVGGAFVPNVVEYDYLREYENVLGTWTARRAGLYLFDAGLTTFSSLADASLVVFQVARNGPLFSTTDRRLVHSYTGALGSVTATGSSVSLVAVGDVFRWGVAFQTSTVLVAGSAFSWLSVTQLR